MFIKILAADHLVSIRVDLQQTLETLTIEIEVRPLLEDDRFKKIRLLFPKNTKSCRCVVSGRDRRP